jgi:hypothetical protein
MQLTVMLATDCAFTAEDAVAAAVPPHEAMVDLAIAVAVVAAATTDTQAKILTLRWSSPSGSEFGLASSGIGPSLTISGLAPTVPGPTPTGPGPSESWPAESAEQLTTSRDTARRHWSPLLRGELRAGRGTSLPEFGSTLPAN